MATDVICVTLVETHTVTPSSLYERAYTVQITQEYVLRVDIPGGSLTIRRRYRELKRLQGQVTATQLAPIAEAMGITLPAFPKTAWLSMRPAVVEERRRLIENYLRVALLSPILVSPILDFFDVNPSEIKQVISALEGQEAKPLAQQLNDGEQLIQTFNARLLREPNNKVRVIEDFDQRFFGLQRFIRYEFSVLLLSDVVPLCADPVFGSKALDIVYKILSREWVRSHQEFRSALVKLPPEMLATMHLDEYLIGDIRSANSQAFTVFSAIYDYYQRGGQMGKALRVLNGNAAAMELFEGWVNGCISPRIHEEERPRRKSGEWVELSRTAGDLSLKHREMEGVLELMITLLIHVPPDQVLPALTEWKIRQKWDETMRSLKVLKQESDTEALVSIEVELDRELVQLILRQITKTYPSGAIMLEYHQPTPESSTMMEFLYTLTPTMCNIEARKPSGESSNSSDGSPNDGLRLFPTPSCVLVYQMRLRSDLRKYIISELAGERNSIKTSCIALKTALETGDFEGVRERAGSVASLNAAVDSKILKKSVAAARRRLSKGPGHM